MVDRMVPIGRSFSCLPRTFAVPIATLPTICFSYCLWTLSVTLLVLNYC